MRPVPRPTEIEAMANLLMGPDAGVEPLPDAPRGGFQAALEQVLLGSLQRTPCVVSFSGGRDSSAVLAAATDVARRHGLPLPVPVTMRFPDVPESDESYWQRLVLDHLGLKAETVTLTDELDAVGAAATAGLLRLGARWPANTYLHAPVLELARGGALLTGVGGDELLGTQASLHVRLLRGRARPRRAGARILARDLRTRRAREALWLRDPPPYPWLTPAGEAQVHAALARDDTSWPHRWDRAVDHWHGSRAFAAVAGAIALYAEPYDVEVVQPLVDATVLAALKRVGGPTGWRDRTDAMRLLFGHLLPGAVLARETKAAFRGAVYGPRTRAFARTWGGAGVNPALVDVEALRGVWLSEGPDARGLVLLHRAWLASQPETSSSS